MSRLSVRTALRPPHGTSLHYAQPIQIAKFGLDKDHNKIQVENDDEAFMKMYKEPSLPVDLNRGFDATTYVQAQHWSVRAVFETLKEKNIDLTGAIVTYRNNLNKILASPCSRDEWAVEVYRHNDTLFLGIVHTQPPLDDPKQKRFTYWGYNFEEYCTLASNIDTPQDTTISSPSSSSSSSTSLSPAISQSCVIMETSLNSNKIIMGAEIDCFGGSATHDDSDALDRFVSSWARAGRDPHPSSSSSSYGRDNSRDSSHYHRRNDTYSDDRHKRQRYDSSSSSSSSASSSSSSSSSPYHYNTSSDRDRRRDDAPRSSSSRGPRYSPPPTSSTSAPAPMTFPSPSQYIELKTARLIDHGGTENTFRKFKLMHFWIQSFLAGVPTILVGFRDDDGFVRSLQRLRTVDIPDMALGKWNAWDCLTFADSLFAWVRRHTEHGGTYMMRFRSPYQDVEMDTMDKKDCKVYQEYVSCFEPSDVTPPTDT